MCYNILIKIRISISDVMSLFIKKAKYKNGKTYCSIVDGYRINNKVKQNVITKLWISIRFRKRIR